MINLIMSVNSLRQHVLCICTIKINLIKLNYSKLDIFVSNFKQFEHHWSKWFKAGFNLRFFFPEFSLQSPSVETSNRFTFRIDFYLPTFIFLSSRISFTFPHRSKCSPHHDVASAMFTHANCVFRGVFSFRIMAKIAFSTLVFFLR